MNHKKSKYTILDFSKVKRYPIRTRLSKVKLENFAEVYEPDASFGRFIHSLPDLLVGKDFKEIIEVIALAVKKEKPVLWMTGAHVVKVGLNPLLVDLMERKIISSIALNGAGAIHDAELALFGATSEDVSAGLKDGSFGMAEETGDFINHTLNESRGLGYGEALGKKLIELKAPNLKWSVLGRGYELNIPVTVHSAIGTEITHQHPGVDGSVIGEAAYRDFQIFSEMVSKIGNGGVVINVGSSVIMPEIFLKALTVTRNLGFDTTHFVTVDIDMIRHYRPTVNVVQRPTQNSGRGYQITGHHELIIPLLAAAIKLQLKTV